MAMLLADLTGYVIGGIKQVGSRSSNTQKAREGTSDDSEDREGRKAS